MTELTSFPDETETRVQRVKRHIVENKDRYICLAVGLVVGGVAIAYEQNRRKDDVPLLVNNNIQNNYKIDLVERATLSKPVQLIRTNGSSATYNSMSEAARESEYSMNQLRQAMTGETLYDGTVVISLKDAA